VSDTNVFVVLYCSAPLLTEFFNDTKADTGYFYPTAGATQGLTETTLGYNDGLALTHSRDRLHSYREQVLIAPAQSTM